MPSHVQLWAERQRELSAWMPRRGGNHEKMWRSRNFYHENFQSWDFQQFHENFEPRKFGAIRYLIAEVLVLKRSIFAILILKNTPDRLCVHHITQLTHTALPRE